MANISEQIYEQRMEQSPEPIKIFLSKIFFDENFLSFIERHRGLAQNKEDLADSVRNEVLKYSLKISASDQFIDNVVEILDIKPDEAEKMIADLFSMCIPENIQNIIERNKSLISATDEGRLLNPKDTDMKAISHKDLLSEIENPTPSISTTASFQNSASKAAPAEATRAARPATPTAAGASSTDIIKSAASAEASLHSSAAVPAYANPALKVASRLDQNMSTPSASIPKDIYVSKKPDPYHEPVDL